MLYSLANQSEKTYSAEFFISLTMSVTHYNYNFFKSSIQAVMR